MKFSPLKVASWIALLSGTSFLPARGAETAGNVVAPGATLSATLTNLSRSAPRKDGLKELEEELSRSLQPFSPRGSLDSILTPRYIPPPAVVPNRRPRSDVENRRNWIFRNAEEATGMGQDPFKALQGAGKKNAWEELYRNLDPQRPSSSLGSTKSGDSTAQGFKALDDLDDESVKLPSGLKESAKNLRDKLLGSDSIFSPGASRGGLSSLFAPEDNGLSREQMQAHKEYRERYRQTLEIPTLWSTSPQNLLNSPLGSGTSPSTPGFTGLDSLSPSTRRDSFASTPAAANSVLRPTTIPDQNERVLNQWNPLYAPPTIEASKPVPFASPVAEAPRRKF